ncbi:MAG TPA: NRDE family protein [Acidimicrobiales bacterium]
MHPVCLLVVCSRVVPSFPLVVAANRDERLDRPATPITVLRESGPRVLGGRDELAGGTWLAVNDHGVVAGLTNRPSALGKDPTRRSRGELPLLLASAESAAHGVSTLAARVRPSEYNAAWMLVGDRRSLHYVELDGESRLVHLALAPGIHILENLAIGAPSTKVDRARELLGDPSHLSFDALLERLTGVLADHVSEPDRSVPLSEAENRSARRPACVHGDAYGTRSSMIVVVPDNEEPSRVYVADGRPCETPFVDESARWLVDSTT